jgi:hypothetical protein
VKENAWLMWSNDHMVQDTTSFIPVRPFGRRLEGINDVVLDTLNDDGGLFYQDSLASRPTELEAIANIEMQEAEARGVKQSRATREFHALIKAGRLPYWAYLIVRQKYPDAWI